MRTASYLTCLAGLLLLACRDALPDSGRPTTLATHPHAMDRVARLMREEFTAPDPLPVEQQIRCENARVKRVLGDDFARRMALLQDSLRLEFSGEQLNQLGQRLGRAPTASGYDPRCRSIDAEAQREVPLGNSAPERIGGI